MIAFYVNDPRQKLDSSPEKIPAPLFRHRSSSLNMTFTREMHSIPKEMVFYVDNVWRVSCRISRSRHA